MSEKEFKADHFKNIEELIQHCKMWINDDDYDAYCRFFDMGAMEELIKELEKEKEKREIAEENHKVLSLDLGQALKELGLYEDTIIADELVLEINKKYITKDKIKEKIKELEKDDTTIYKMVKGKMIIEVLQELLEERN